MKKQTKLGLVLAAAAVISVSVASLVSARGWVQQGADWYYVGNDGEYVVDTIQTSGNAKFYLGEDGQMMRDYFLEEYSGSGAGTYYFGSNGAMVTNTWVAIESSRVENQQDYVPDNYWYYFQASGKAMKASTGSSEGKKTTIDGKKYIFNEYGQMLTGWIQDGKTVNPDDNDDPFEAATYYAGGDNDGVLRSGWVTYYDGYSGSEEYLADKANLYFYFNTNNNKKVGDGKNETKKINGKTYAFNDKGIMLSGWDVVNEGIGDISTKTVYFSGEDDGHQVKKGWVYDVPAESIDKKAYDDGEEKYMYFNNSGEAATDQVKKINGKYYCFNRDGIMKTGIVVWANDGANDDNAKFVTTLDLDYANGEDVAKKGILQYDADSANDVIKVFPNGEVWDTGDSDKVAVGKKVVLHYFGSDGSRRTGTNNIDFADDQWTFVSKNGGNKDSGVSSKKYYSLGILLKASNDIKYGIYNTDFPTATDSMAGMAFTAQVDDYFDNLVDGKYLVLNTSGGKVKDNKTAKKDADGNYWMIAADGLVGIYSVNVKNTSGNFETRVVSGQLYNGTELLVNGGIVENLYDLAVANDILDQLFVIGANPALDTYLGLDGSEAGWWKYTTKDNGGYFTMYSDNTSPVDKKGISTYAFQSDLRGTSNKWTAFGILDDSRQTCTEFQGKNSTIGADIDSKAHAYEVTPNNDYFLNCYWTE